MEKKDCGVAAPSVERPFCNSREPNLLQRVSQGDEVSPDPEEPILLADAMARVPNGIADSADSRLLREELAVAKFILDQNGIVLYRARMEEGLPIEYVSGSVAHFGYSAEQFKSGAVSFADVVHPADRDRVLAELHDHVAHGRREFIQQYRIIAARGAVLWIEDRTFVRDIADGAGIYLEGILTDVTERHRAQERLRQSLTQTIGAIAATIDKRDPYTAGHQRRVAALSRAIAEQLGLGADQTEGVYLGALVHDVGKMAIPVDILSRPGRLSFEEFALVKTHVRAGVDVLRDVVFPLPIIDMVAQHHERLNGSGYPAGLSGDSIQLEARIIAVADVFESMSTHRPYRPALAVGVALDELSRGRSNLFDADAVDACLAIARAHAGDQAALWAALERGRDTPICADDQPLTKLDPARD
jgi:putative nucleotidyltransferase with HDIG domain/PAS domain S-box-containing protein